MTGATDPVVQVVDESKGEIVYTLRIKGSSFRPKVFAEGAYTVKVDGKTYPGVKSVGLDDPAKLEVRFQ